VREDEEGSNRMEETASQRESQLRADLGSLRIDRSAAGVDAGRRRERRLLVVAAALVLAAAGVLLVRSLGNRPVEVSVITARRLDPQTQRAMPLLSGAGYVVTGDRYVSLGVRVPGKIERYFVQEGEAVRKGDPLVQLDDRDYRAAVARAEAALAVGRANLELAEAELRRGLSLRQGNVISQQEIEVQQNKRNVSRATLAQLEAELEQARVSLEYTLLRAPSDGVVLAKLKEVGEIAVPGGFAGSGELIRLANLTDLRAEVDVNEADLNRIRLGQPAEVTPDAYPDAHYAAEVVKLYPQVDRQKGTLKVEARVLRPDNRLLPDMSARVTFLEPLPAAELAAPPVLVAGTALRRDAGGEPFVWVVRNGAAARAPVKIANPGGDPARVTEGLSGGEAVIVSDDGELDDGRAVRVSGGSS